MKKEDWISLWDFLHKYLLNKYILTLVLFAFVLTFCGEQSLTKRAKRAYEIAQKEHELEDLHEATRQAREEIEMLEKSTENVERYAREHYYMHADGEDVYLVEEE